MTSPRMVTLRPVVVVARVTVRITGMVKVDVVPVVGEVTVGTLTGPVSGRRGMAALAVVKAGVVNVDLVPGVGIVANRALPGPVLGRPGMTILAIVVAGMIKVGISPGGCIVTVGTLAVEMIRRSVVIVTIPAIVKVVVVAEIDVVPVVGVVALGALAKVVIGAAVAFFTIGEVGMVKPVIAPGIHRVTIGALAGVV